MNSVDDAQRVFLIIAISVVCIAVIMLIMCICKLYDIITCPCVCLSRMYICCCGTFCCLLGRRNYGEVPQQGCEDSYA